MALLGTRTRGAELPEVLDLLNDHYMFNRHCLLIHHLGKVPEQITTFKFRFFLFHPLQDCLEYVNRSYRISVDAVDAVHLEAGHITDRGVTGPPAAYPQYVGLAP